MDGVQIMELLLHYITYLMPIVIVIVMITKKYNQLLKKNVNSLKLKTDKSENGGELKKFRKLVDLAKEQKPDYYFTDDFYKLFSDINQSSSDDVEQFGSYVALELDCLTSKASKERLKAEIRKAIIEIAEDDAKSYLKNTIANGKISNSVVK